MENNLFCVKIERDLNYSQQKQEVCFVNKQSRFASIKETQ